VVKTDGRLVEKRKNAAQLRSYLGCETNPLTFSADSVAATD